MSNLRKGIETLVRKIIQLEDDRLKAGHYVGQEKKVTDILDMARKVIGSEVE